jgi:hypothetical protein
VKTGLAYYTGLLPFGLRTALQRLGKGDYPDPLVSVDQSEGTRIGCVLGIAPEAFHKARLRRSPKEGLISSAG